MDKSPHQEPNKLIKLIQNHYGNTKCIKSESQIASEAYLCPGIPYSRWFCMPAAVIPQFCTGSLYAWSVFNKPIDIQIFGEVTNMAPITFTIAIGFLGFSAAVMGPWLERNGPKKGCLLGSSLFFCGNLLTALALYLQQLWLVFLGYGVIGGLGIGLCYISPVSALQKWFPDRRGLAAGVAVCGFGAGSIAMAKVQSILLEIFGLPLTFLILGCSYFILMTASAFVLRTPPPNYSVGSSSPTVTETDLQSISTITVTSFVSAAEDSPIQTMEDDWTLLAALSSKDFRLIYFAFLSNIVFGLVLISRMSNMVTDIFEQTTEAATTAVSINGGFNLAGRLLFSVSSDYVGRKNCYIVMLTLQLIILVAFCFITWSRTYWAFLLTMWTLTACYGAGFSVIPAFLCDKFGPRNIGACHGVILTAWSIAGVVGGLVFTALFNSLHSSGYEPSDPFPYNVNAWWILGVVVVGWSCLIFVQPTKKDVLFINVINPRSWWK